MTSHTITLGGVLWYYIFFPYGRVNAATLELNWPPSHEEADINDTFIKGTYIGLLRVSGEFP